MPVHGMLDPFGGYQGLLQQNRSSVVPGTGVLGLTRGYAQGLERRAREASLRRTGRENDEIVQYGRVLSPWERFTTTLPVSDSPADVQSTLATVAGAPIAGGIVGRVMSEPLSALRGMLDPRVPGGVLGTMAGARAASTLRSRHAEYAPEQALRMAQHMEARGLSRERIWDATAEHFRREGAPYSGVYKGVDGKWRFEIPDAPAVLADDIPATRSALPDVLEHPELSRAYPETRDFGVTGHTRNLDSSFNLGTKTADISTLGNAGDRTGALLHETQHGIQGLEQFAGGGDPADFARIAKHQFDAAARLMDDYVTPGMDFGAWYRTTKPSGNHAEIAARYAEDSGLSVDQAMDALQMNWDQSLNRINTDIPMQKKAELEEFMGGLDLTGRRDYHRLAGEAEARMVARRKGLSLEELRRNYPWLGPWTDVPEAEQLVKREGLLR